MVHVALVFLASIAVHINGSGPDSANYQQLIETSGPDQYVHVQGVGGGKPKRKKITTRTRRWRKHKETITDFGLLDSQLLAGTHVDMPLAGVKGADITPAFTADIQNVAFSAAPMTNISDYADHRTYIHTTALPIVQPQVEAPHIGPITLPSNYQANKPAEMLIRIIELGHFKQMQKIFESEHETRAVQYIDAIA